MERTLGNLIGTKKDGASNLGNSVDGVSIHSADNKIGGNTAGEANIIASNVFDGMQIESVPALPADTTSNACCATRSSPTEGRA